MREKMLIFLVLLCLFLLAFGAGYMRQQTKLLEQERDRLEAEIELLEAENAYLRIKIQELRSRQSEVLRRMEEWLDAWEVELGEVTAYAPLDPRAKKGMCYSGDPRVTASGVPVVFGETAAASTSVPFGTRVWVENIGFRTITDRGSRIGDGNIDIAVESREEALKLGREKRKVVYKK